MERKENYTIEDIKTALADVVMLPKKTPNKIRDINLDGDYIHGNSQRYQVFFTKDTVCACCGLKGKYFAKERSSAKDRFHLNLYGVTDEGEEVLMTKDHIIPKSKGGKNILSNYQTLCVRCNQNKADTL